MLYLLNVLLTPSFRILAWLYCNSSLKILILFLSVLILNGETGVKKMSWIPVSTFSKSLRFQEHMAHSLRKGKIGLLFLYPDSWEDCSRGKNKSLCAPTHVCQSFPWIIKFNLRKKVPDLPLSTKANFQTASERPNVTNLLINLTSKAALDKHGWMCVASVVQTSQVCVLQDRWDPDLQLWLLKASLSLANSPHCSSFLLPSVGLYHAWSSGERPEPAVVHLLNFSMSDLRWNSIQNAKDVSRNRSTQLDL